MKTFALILLVLFIVAFSAVVVALSNPFAKAFDRIMKTGCAFLVLASIGSIPFFIWYLVYGI